jgi:hypothetical protein
MQYDFQDSVDSNEMKYFLCEKKHLIWFWIQIIYGTFLDDIELRSAFPKKFRIRPYLNPQRYVE